MCKCDRDVCGTPKLCVMVFCDTPRTIVMVFCVPPKMFVMVMSIDTAHNALNIPRHPVGHVPMGVGEVRPVGWNRSPRYHTGRTSATPHALGGASCCRSSSLSHSSSWPTS